MARVKTRSKPVEARWTIALRYTTGGSFETHQETDEVPITWKNLEKAKEALSWIREDHEVYLKHYKWNNKQTQEEKKAEREALASSAPDYDGISMMLPIDGAGVQQIHKFWQGYFETLHEAKIVVVVDKNDDSDMVYTPGY